MAATELVEYYEKSRSRIIAECSKCGLCLQDCSLNGHILKDLLSGEVQDKVIDFLREGKEDDVVYERGFSCLQCFKCVNKCPQGLNPLLVNELIKWDYRRKDIQRLKYNDPEDVETPQRVLASIQLSKGEYQRIFHKSEKKKTKYVFFPGCNVYFQPEKILSTIDILELITDDCAFLPGLDNCCGRVQLFNGDILRAQEVMERLIVEVASYQPETVIVWCPTCLCNFETTISKVVDLPFKVVSVAQFIADNMDKLELKNSIDKRVTLHEACKSSLLGLDVHGIREILKQLPSLELVEMKRHGENTLCCGLGAQNYSKDIMDCMKNYRLKEAADTNAEILVDVCHACHKLFLQSEQRYTYNIINYINLLTHVLGIERKDKLKEYIELNDLDSILDIAASFIREAPYTREQIERAIRRNILTKY
jgi:Fe-S oxidoreductase